MISIIFAMGRNRVIGKDNNLPWRLPADLAYFKSKTIGHTVIMGRKTYESLGKPLPGRNNVVITRNRALEIEGCTVYSSIEEALRLGDSEEVFVIGGADIYKSFLPYADKLYITSIDDTFEGDTFFPEIDYSLWRLVSDIPGEKNEKNPYMYSFLVYERR